MSKVKFVSALAFCVFLTPAFAQSLVEREARAEVEKSLAKKVEFYTTKYCKVNIPAKIDWSTFNSDERGLADYCAVALFTISRICEDSEDGMKSVQDKVKSVTCTRTSPSTLALENGEFVYGIDVSKGASYAVREKIQKFLEEKL